MTSTTTTKSGKRPLSQLERAFHAIEALVNATQPLKLNALSEVTQLDGSGTLRLLKTLTDLGYVIRDDEHKCYLPSARALYPLGLYHPLQELRRDASDLLLEIQRITTVTSALQIFLGGQRVVVDQRYGSSRLTPFWDTSVKSPLHSSSSGKLFLTTLSDAERRQLLGPEPYPAFTPTTLVTYSALQDNLQLGLERGFFIAREEAFAGMSSAAAPLRVSHGGIIGAIVATGTAGQLQGEKLLACGQLIKQSADMLSTMSPAVRALESLLGTYRHTLAPADRDAAPAATQPTGRADSPSSTRSSTRSTASSATRPVAARKTPPKTRRASG